MIKNTLSIIVMLSLYGAAFTQTQTLTYERENHTIRLTDNASAIAMTDYKKSKTGLRERTVAMNGDTFNIAISKTKEGPVQTITDSQGNRVATVYLGSKNHYDIMLADGTMLDWNSPKGRQWNYKVNGKEVIKASYIKAEGKKKLVVESLEPQFTTPAVQISCIERGTDKIASSSQTGKMILVGVILAGMRFAVASGM